MNIYVRRVDFQSVNKQISILKEVVQNFFDNKEFVNIVGKNSNYKGTVDILLATDPRLGGDIKKIISNEGGMKEGDLLLFRKIRSSYTLEVVKPTDSRYIVLNEMFDPSDKHLEFFVDESNKDSSKENNNTLVGYNKIFYGIPGCGKSYHVENFELKGVDKEKDVIRTTFYLDYANSDFIGQLYPHVDEKGDVTYTHIPGPFTEALERAFNNKGKMIYLVIEEINRGNAAAIFGDVFQLLDRLKEDRDGRRVGDSEYPISNAFIEDYFKKEKVDYTPGQIYIPRNLTIFATMNTSDQNVFPLDTAFKRRWDREMVTADWDKVSFRNKYVPCTNITWEKFATVINKEILKQNDDSDVTISEDKQIGAFFVRESMLSDVEKDGTRDQLIPFVTNVIDYLYNDVTKFDHKILFNKDITSYDNLYEKMEVYINNYDKNINESGCGPLEILFNDDLVDILKNSSEDE